LLLKKIIIAILTIIPAIIFTGCATDQNAPPSDDTDINTKAYLLKIDGKDIAYLSSETELQELNKLLIEEKRASLEEMKTEIVEIKISNKIELSEAFCRPEDIKSVDEATQIYYSNGGKISFSFTVNEYQTKYISFNTVYQNSSSHYEGTSVVKTDGANGEDLLTYQVTYLDDAEVTRELISEKTVKKPTDKIVLVGTKKSTASTGSYRWPTQSVYITSYYGARTLNGKYDYHLGIDLRASVGTNIYAADGGKVTYAGYLGSYGYLIKIQHDNGDETYYAHLSKISVKVGTRVYKGQIIGKSGISGNVTGPHLHFEIRKNGKTVNPIKYLPKI